MKEKKSHKLLALFSPIICLIYVIAASLATGTLENKLSGVSGFIISNIVAVVLTLLAVLIYVAICKKYSIDAKLDLKLTKKEKCILILMSLIMPIILIIGHQLSYFIYTRLMGEGYIQIAYTVEDFKEDMMSTFHAIIIAPILEEFCFRVIPISLCQKKAGKIIMLLITSLLFGFCHGKNFWLTMINGIIFGLIFILTNRPIISIVCHMAHNFFSFIFGIIAYVGLATIYTCSNRPTLMIFDVIPAIAVSVVFIAVWFIFFITFTKANKK